MQLKEVNENFFIADQLGLDDLEGLANQGIRTLIGNRPDFEQPGQPTFAEISTRARELGIAVHYLPVVHPTINSRDVREFTELLQSAPVPVLAWCRSGQRSLTLWCLSRMQMGDDSAALVSQAKNLGFDFSNISSKFADVIAELH